jgi:hypothetical protein
MQNNKYLKFVNTNADKIIIVLGLVLAILWGFNLIAQSGSDKNSAVVGGWWLVLASSTLSYLITKWRR